ncbi:hypothetical protein FX988_02530 [Paraglaciecola mesophila]|uniref:Uncharacterized protein n=1 Tax=Paraglaciecola mesophila TaxID=197222 RepID=A0A857JJP2_9ALTE|nr:hypothetical protein [Paraglaciecola mesophila]QHJ12279.1 hypothetical protein FX988_02530 [Paraglaciecola mesophila]
MSLMARKSSILMLRGILISLLFCTTAQAVPELCLQSKARSEMCPHLLYKKSPIDIAGLSVKTGDMVCLCLSDVAGIRGASEEELSRPKLLVSLRRLAGDWDLSESELLRLIRK